MNKEQYVKEILLASEHELELSDRSYEINLQIEQKESQNIIKCLKKTMEEKGLVMLAAPEIGFKRRIFCIKFDLEIKTFINPLMTSCEDIQMATETSVVIPNQRYIRPRGSKVSMIYQRPTGQSESREFHGMAAVLVQQGIDALDGILESDIGLPVEDDFFNASEEERQEVIDFYLQGLDLKVKKLDEIVEADSLMKNTRDAIKYRTSVITGETKLLDEEPT